MLLANKYFSMIVVGPIASQLIAKSKALCPTARAQKGQSLVLTPLNPTMDSHEPSFEETYKTLLQDHSPISINYNATKDYDHHVEMIEDCDLPLINLSRLMSSNNDKLERDKCIHEVIHAATNWGFFQIVNHGVSKELLKSLENEQKKLFSQPFKNKTQNHFLNLPPNSYRWGNPKATCLKQLSWSEALHLSINDIPTIMEDFNHLRLAMEGFANIASEIANTLVEILAQNLGSMKPSYFQENCPQSSSYLRLNRYPPCPDQYSSSKLIFGLIPHTDTDFMTVVRQDQIGGLQLLREGRWFGVKPNPEALIINIGDLFQALSNGLYKSVKHRVVASGMERFSFAYFYCPSNEAIVESFGKSPPIYRKFSFREYKEQTKKDVEDTGEKVGLQRFLLL